MPQTFNVNTDEVVKLSNKLEKVHKSAFPVAVRGTLNDAAFEAKQKHVEKIFKKNFVIRKPTFIRSHTIVNKSPNTFNVNQMVSEMGIIKGKSQAGDELETQEFGGTVKSRDYIPTPKARVSQAQNKLVSRSNYRTKMKQRNFKTHKTYKKFAKSAYYFGKKSIILFRNVLVKIQQIKKDGAIKFRNLYSFKSGRSIKITKKPFIAPAGVAASKNIPVLYGKNAEKQFNKYLK